jgi:rhodanese-related sulfurtransferase
MATFLSRLLRRPKPQDVAWIEIDSLRHRLAQGESVALIDVRGRDEFNAPPGHLPNAVNVPLPELPNRIDEIAAHKRPVILVCKTDRRSAKAAVILRNAGLQDVAVLRDGTDGWHQQGLPLD